MKTVKRIYFLGVIAFFFNDLNAQNHNLEFNQIINQNISNYFESGCCNQTVWVTSSTFNVPNNRIWKVEGLYRFFDGWGGSGVTSYIIDLNNPSNLLKSNIDNNILWLPSGNYAIKTSIGCTGSCNGTIFSTLNAIEFNVVP
jgi:hypothetical protein